MNKPFSKIFNKYNDKDKNEFSSKINPEKKSNEKSKSLIVLGSILSLSSIFLLLYTINNKFGWFK